MTQVTVSGEHMFLNNGSYDYRSGCMIIDQDV